MTITRDEAVKLLQGGRGGVDEWNRRRKAGEGIPSLAGVNLAHTNLGGVDPKTFDPYQEFSPDHDWVRGAILRDADLTGAILLDAMFQDTDLRGADLSRADLRGSDLRHSDLSDAILRNAMLAGARLGAELNENTDFTGAHFGNTAVKCDVSIAKGINEANHDVPSSVDINAIVNFQGELPETFLRGCGIREEEIAYFRSVVGKPIRFYSCFISSSTADEKLATRLHNDFQAAGIRCWKWDHDARTGRSLWGEIDQAIRVHDKLVLIASESSLTSPAVNREIERAIVEEDKRSKKKRTGDYDGSTDVLFPVRVDEFIFDGWQHERKVDVTKKVIADATGWEQDNEKYQAVLARLIRDLKDEPEAT